MNVRGLALGAGLLVAGAVGLAACGFAPRTRTEEFSLRDQLDGGLRGTHRFPVNSGSATPAEMGAYLLYRVDAFGGNANGVIDISSDRERYLYLGEKYTHHMVSDGNIDEAFGTRSQIGSSDVSPHHVDLTLVYRDADANRNGKISQNELGQLFTGADFDNNAQVSETELTEWSSAHGYQWVPEGRSINEFYPQRLIPVNHDGQSVREVLDELAVDFAYNNLGPEAAYSSPDNPGWRMLAEANIRPLLERVADHTNDSYRDSSGSPYIDRPVLRDYLKTVVDTNRDGLLSQAEIDANGGIYTIAVDEENYRDRVSSDAD